MAVELFANLPSTTVLSGGTTAPASGTSESWTVSSSASFPAAASGASQFHVADVASNSEIIAVTNVSGTTWTVTRGAESTTPVVHQAGFTIYQVMTAGWLNSIAATAISPSGDATGVTDTVAFNAALSGLPTVNSLPAGQVILKAGTWYLTTGSVNNTGPYVQVRGYGPQNTIVNAVGGAAGDLARAFNPIVPQLGIWGTITGGYWGGGGWGELTIDGTSAAAGSTGYHYGDNYGFRNPNLTVQNFSGAGSIGVRRDNTLWWTEEEDSGFTLLNNTTGFVFDVSDGPAYTSVTLVSAAGGTATFTRSGGWAIPGGYGYNLQAGMLLTGSAGLTTPSSGSVSTLSVSSVSGNTLTCTYTGTDPSGSSGTLTVTNSTNSHAYSDLRFRVRAAAAQDGVVVQNGSNVYNGSLWHRGNYSNSASALSNTTLRIKGTTTPAGHPNQGTASQVARMNFDWKAETNQSGGNHPFSIVITNAGNGVFSSNGMVDFAAGTWQAASLVGTDAWQFYGTVYGDTTLQRSQFVTATGTRTATQGETTVCTSGTFTLTLPKPVKLFFNRVTNTGSGTITVHPISGTLANLSGATGDITLTQGQTALFTTDGTNYFQVG